MTERTLSDINLQLQQIKQELKDINANLDRLNNQQFRPSIVGINDILYVVGLTLICASIAAIVASASLG